MGSYKIEFKHPAEKELRKLESSIIPLILDRIERLSTNPRPPQSKKLATSETSYRLRVRAYHIVYQIDEAKKKLTIYRIRHRKESYRED